MVLEKLGESLKNTLGKIAKSIFVDDKLLNELIKDMQRALLQSDVNVQLVFDLSGSIRSRIKTEETPPGMTKKEHLIKIVYDELTKFLGDKSYELKIEKKPTKIMLVGLFGNGKTTSAGKLAKYFQKKGNKVALISLDVWRPAAFEQLKQLGARINAPVFGDTTIKDPIKIYKKFESELAKFGVVIVDTAGRDALSDDLIEELNEINSVVNPDAALLVMSADVGQAAKDQAEAFVKTCNVSGVIITKMDGTAKGGGALTACHIANAPVKFIGVGEKIDDLELFDPKRFVSRLLGMGDIQTLLEKAREAMDEGQAEDLGKKFLKGDFSLVDLYEQMEAMKKMGPLSKVVEMIPGFSQLKLPKEALQVQQEKLKIWKYILNSCTKEELEDPDIITSSRVERIAKGSGVNTKDVRELLKQYKQSKKMAKMLKGGDMSKVMKKFKMKGM